MDYDTYLSDCDNVTFKDISKVKEADCADRIVICDEFDEMIDRNTVLFFNNPFTKKVEVSGMLATTKAKKLFLLSATIDKYHSVFCLKVLKLKPT